MRRTGQAVRGESNGNRYQLRQAMHVMRLCVALTRLWRSDGYHHRFLWSSVSGQWTTSRTIRLVRRAACQRNSPSRARLLRAAPLRASCASPLQEAPFLLRKRAAHLTGLSVWLRPLALSLMVHHVLEKRISTSPPLPLTETPQQQKTLSHGVDLVAASDKRTKRRNASCCCGAARRILKAHVARHGKVCFGRRGRTVV